VVALGLAPLISSTATAAPEPTLTQVRAKVERLRAQAEQAEEDYGETRERLHSIEVRTRATRVRQVAQQRELRSVRRQLGRIAAETYRRGEFSSLDLMLGDDEDAYLAQSGYLPSMADRQSVAADRLKRLEHRLADLRTRLRAEETEARQAKERMSGSRRVALRRLSQAKAELARLTPAQRVRVERPPSGGELPSGSQAALCADYAASARTTKARTAIRFACSQLGDPYSWGAAGPGSWDCSGLTMRAWGAAGVSLPHSSRMQANQGRRISLSDLEPGDLVFYHSPISHVAIWLGPDVIVHAPQSGDVVRVRVRTETPTAAVRL
jgi:cell wall-associated NlpC family hydrolase